MARNNPRRKQASRRQLLSHLAAGTMAVTVVPRHVLGGPGFIAPSERVRMAGIGVGGMGGGDVATLTRLGAEYVALCDVDEQRAAGTFGGHKGARRYKDFRQMLDKEAKHIDSVSVGTPDHTHAVATLAALKLGKHVYCQKPLTQTLGECRAVYETAQATGVMTSMGNQGHATEGARLTNEWIRSGLIGEVLEVHAWSDRAGKLWKQGIGRPKDTPPTPATLDWDLWLGPRAYRPYNPAYAPHSWRGWLDFGTGALGDMGCHILDHPIWALDLGAPSLVESRVTLDGSVVDGKPNNDSFPIASVIYYTFAGKNGRPPVHLTWYDGGLMPPAPAKLPAGQRLPDNGVLYIGTKGKMFHSSHGGMPQVLPGELREQAIKVPKTMERSPGHYEEFIRACKGGPKPVANFGYSAPMTETVLLGVLSLRVPGTRLEWDSANLKVKGMPELDRLIRPEPRKGWEG